VHRNLLYDGPAKFVEYTDGTAMLIDTLTDGVGAGFEYYGTPIDFVSAQTHLEGLSLDLSDLPANGSTSVSAQGEVRRTGSNPLINVFDVDGGDLADATYISVDAPTGSLVVVNIAGGTGFSNRVLETIVEQRRPRRPHRLGPRVRQAKCRPEHARRAL